MNKLKNAIDYVLYFWLENWNKIGIGIKEIVSPDEISKKIYFVIIELFKSFGRLFSKSLVSKTNTNLKNDCVVFYCQTQNNINSIASVVPELQLKFNTVILVSKNANIQTELNVFKLNYRFLLVYQIFYIPYFVLLLRKEKYRQIANMVFESLGLLNESIRILRYLQPKALVLLNDHSPKARALLLASKFLGISSIYIQHATVSNLFPPLDFNYSILDGAHSENVYRNVRSEVYTVFPARLKMFVVNRRNDIFGISKIGIAYNELDSLEKVGKLIGDISANFPDVSIIIRPHPSDVRVFDVENHHVGQTKIKVDRETSLVDFLGSVDLLIAGNSGIHLEACLMNVQSILVNITLDNDSEDLFNFTDNNLARKCDSMADLLTYISQFKFEADHFKKANRYVSEDDGSIANLLEEIIGKI